MIRAFIVLCCIVCFVGLRGGDFGEWLVKAGSVTAEGLGRVYMYRPEQCWYGHASAQTGCVR